MAGVGIVISVQEAADHLPNAAMRRAMRAVFDTASQVASPTAVVTVFPDADPRVLEMCIAGFNEELAAMGDTSWAPQRSPIMVIGGFGGARWCGGSAPLRSVLTILGNTGGSLNSAQAANYWQRAGGDPAECWRVLRDQPQLLTVHAERLELRLSPRIVYRTLTENVERALSEAIDHGGPGVRIGRVRGPALRVTDRSIDVETLVNDTIGTPLAAFVLARKIEAALQPLAAAVLPTAIAQVAHASPALAMQLSECLGLGGRSFPTPSELDVGDIPAGERVPPGETVVLCTDLISTENSVRRAAAAIAGGQAQPLIIACVVDARQKHGPVRLLNHTIQVVSLASAAINSESDSDEPIIDLDPLLLRPHVPVPTPRTSVADTEFLSWCSSVPGALRLGHIDWQPNRHFSAFIRLDSLLRHNTSRRKIIDSVLTAVERAFIDIGVANRPGGGDRPWEIWYVNSRDGGAELLAKAIHAELISRGEQTITLTQVPRGIAGNAWAFPATLGETGSARPIVVLGWAATTGGTMLQLIRLAAESGAAAVVAVSMLNQLDASEAEVLPMVRSIAGPDNRPVPVAMRFVTGSSITPLAAHDCAICSAHERYEMDDDAPEQLRMHAARLHEMLRPRGQDELSHDAATDLFTVPISNDDVIDYLRWRGLLLHALRDPGARQNIIDRLEVLAQEQLPVTWNLPGLIRLLAAEQQWLKLPPLRFSVARDLLTEACVTGLEKSVTAPAWLRLQTLMVLSVTVPDRLAELLPKILVVIADEPILVEQLFLDVYRMLRRPPLDSPIDNEKLRQSLSQARDYLEKNELASVTSHRYLVRELINIVRHRARPAPKSAQAAWDYLREELVRPVRRHRLEAALLRVRNFVEDLVEVDPTPDSIRRALGDWERCEGQLKHRALVYLPALREIIAGEYASDWLGRKEQPRLLRVIRSGDVALVGVSDLLNRLLQGPWQPGDPGWQDIHIRLIHRLDWWNLMFLTAHMPGNDAPALLVQLIGTAPIELAPAVTATFYAQGQMPTLDRPDLGDVTVFCPTELLDDLICHLLGNIARYRVPDEPCRLNLAYRRSDAESVQLILRNTGTRPRSNAGNGLITFNDKLRPFGGKLSYRVPTDSEWTFEVTATLPIWQGA